MKGSRRVGHVLREFGIGLLQVPLVVKLVVANVALLLAAGAVILISLSRVFPELTSLPQLQFLFRVTLFTLIPSVVLNVLLVRTALDPVRELGKAAERVGSGDDDVRVNPSRWADRELSRVTSTFNRMLDSLAALSRRRRELTATVLEAEDAERRRVSEELFSEPAQVLSTALLELSVLERRMTTPEQRQVADALRDHIRLALTGIRSAAWGLNPPELTELGLIPALQALVRSTAERSGVEMALIVEPTRPVEIVPEKAVTVYRVVQESLANALRHAAPPRIEVRLALRGEHLVVEVRDDGKGFRVPTAPSPRGEAMGLLWMHERAAAVEGTLAIRSAPGEGTTVEFGLPLYDRPPPAA